MRQKKYSRRFAMATGAAFAAHIVMPIILGGANARAAASAKVKIVIIGGGFGGATAARSAKATMPQAEVILLTDQSSF